MGIVSLKFACFVAVLLAVYYAVGKRWPERQWLVLLAGNVLFYCFAWKWWGLLFILFTALVSFGAGRRLDELAAQSKELRRATKDRAEKKQIKERFARRRRILFWVALVAQLAPLAWVKYWNVLLFDVGLTPSPTSLGILLPLGISFYTFQALSYLIDLYNEKYHAASDFGRYLTYVSYFPQLVQGPISRHNELGVQLLGAHEIDPRGMRRALLRLGYGIFKKMVAASTLSGCVTAVFSNVGPETPGSAVAYGLVMYSIWEYMDFSSGIDIVTGVSELFGITLAQNFRQPYFSVSFQDFWQRWHMSLGSWMRDYVFYPIAVSKPLRNLSKRTQARFPGHIGKALPACLANIIVFVIVGLWHGAEWHFLAWGLYQGLAIALADLCAPIFKGLATLAHTERRPHLHAAFAMVRTFVLISIGRIFDVVTDVGAALTCLANMVSNFAPLPFREGLAYMGVESASQFGIPKLALISCAVVFVVSLGYERGIDVRERVLALRAPVRVLLYVALIALVIYSFPYIPGDDAFAYANF